MYTIHFRRFDDGTLYTFGTYWNAKTAQKIVVALAGRADISYVEVAGSNGRTVVEV